MRLSIILFRLEFQEGERSIPPECSPKRIDQRADINLSPLRAKPFWLKLLLILGLDKFLTP